jgi:hypothetical protein
MEVVSPLMTREHIPAARQGKWVSGADAICGCFSARDVAGEHE